MSLTKEQEKRLQEIKEKYRGSTHWQGCETEHERCFFISLIDSLRADLQASLDTPCVVESAFKKMEAELATLKKENDLLQASLKSSDDIRHAEKEILIKEIEMTATLKKENERLQEALKKYGGNLRGCRLMMSDGDEGCTCGFEQALKSEGRE